jgi:hypothetical protein
MIAAVVSHLGNAPFPLQMRHRCNFPHRRFFTEPRMSFRAFENSCAISGTMSGKQVLGNDWLACRFRCWHAICLWNLDYGIRERI